MKKNINYTQKIQYQDIINLNNLLESFKKIKSNTILGSNKKIENNISVKRLEKLYVELKSQKYIPKSSKKVLTFKIDGETRRFGVASEIDKIVQIAILNKLEPVLEKIFLPQSFGFRPGLGCHHALKEIKYNWIGTTWIINVHLKKKLTTFNYNVILEKLFEFCDQPTVELIHKLIKADYIDIYALHNRSAYSENVPKGNLLSPILCNLYFHELDKYVVEKLYPLNNCNIDFFKYFEFLKKQDVNNEKKKSIEQYPKFEKTLNQIKYIKYINENCDNLKLKKLDYVRYADDFLLGFIGSKKEALEISELIKNKLKLMFFEIDDEKSKIYHNDDLGINYLGVYLKYNTWNDILKKNIYLNVNETIKEQKFLKFSFAQKFNFRIPVDIILQRLADKMYIEKKNKTFRATALKKLSLLEDNQIVEHYNIIIKILMNYYSCVNHQSDLWKIFSILKKSCALTLAFKYKIGSASKAYIKFGPYLKIKNDIGEEITRLIYPISLKTKINFKTKNNIPVYADVLELEM